ncbi:Recombinase [Lachnospiraceae bacterium TWA4]|nr:Recombinase [Lachnospiraceae bacterium TWA4]
MHATYGWSMRLPIFRLVEDLQSSAKRGLMSLLRRKNANNRDKAKRKIENKKIRVAAYARTSSDKDAALNSLSSQVSHYNELISKHLDWEFAGIFVDEGISGVKEGRPEFERLLQACREGKIDMVVTKSVTRFARNTLVLLREVRNLKELGVDVYFELENIHTMSITGEIMLTAFASFAEDQAKRISDYAKWSIRKRFENGVPTYFRLYGYEMRDAELIVVPEEAEVVKKIYTDYLSGKGKIKIARELNEAKIKSLKGVGKWDQATIHRILTNEKYVGDILLQKTCTPDFRTKKKVKNNNYMNKYFIQDNHEAIISRGMFDEVQKEISNRSKNEKFYVKAEKTCFSSLLVCGVCDKHFNRRSSRNKKVWECKTKKLYGKNGCTNVRVPESVLEGKLNNVTSSNGKKVCDLLEIKCYPDRVLEFVFRDGAHFSEKWELESRHNSWTKEMKEESRRRSIIRNHIG